MKVKFTVEIDDQEVAQLLQTVVQAVSGGVVPESAPVKAEKPQAKADKPATAKASKPKAEKPEPAQAKADKPSKGSTDTGATPEADLSYQDLVMYLREVSEQHGQSIIFEALAKFGVKSLQQVDAEDYGKIKATVDEIVLAMTA